MRSLAFNDILEDVSRKYARLPKSQISPNGRFPVIDQGSNTIAGYQDDASLCTDLGPVIVFGDHTRIVKYVEGPFTVGADGTKVLRPKDGIHPKFAFRWLQSRNIPSLGYSRHFKLLKEISAAVPTLDDQERIVDILDKADALRSKRREAIVYLESLGQSIFHDMFGGCDNANVIPLTGVARSSDRINYGVVQPGPHVEGGVPLVRVGDFSSGSVDPKKLKLIEKSIDALYKRSRLIGDEILVACVGNIGEIALADSRLAGANIARAVARIPVGPEFERSFVAEWLRSPTAQNYFRKETRTVSQPTLNIKQLGELPVPIVPLGLQQEFAHRMAAVEHLKFTHRAHLAELDNLFASLQDRAFKGEL